MVEPTKRDRLTKAKIMSFRYEGDGQSRDVRWDTAHPGFGVRVYPTGRKAFVLSFRAAGRKRLMVIGDANVLPRDRARELGRRRLVDVEEGRDPLQEKKIAARGKTFGDLLESYIEDHAKLHKKTWEADQRRLNRLVPVAWKGRKADSITGADVAELHRRIGRETPYEANRLLENLRKAYNLAPVWGIVPHSTPNPARGIKRFEERKRKRWVTPEELPAIVRAIDAEANIYVRAAIWLYLLVGVRKSELLEAKRADIDWTRGTLRLSETKSGDEQYAPLSGPAVAILRAIPEQSGNPFILPGAKRGHHLVNISKPWGRIRKAAGADDVRLHDLRRTVGSWMSQAKVDLNRIKDALRHASIATTLTYARLGADPAREAMEEHGRRIVAAAGKAGPAEVVEFRASKR